MSASPALPRWSGWNPLTVRWWLWLLLFVDVCLFLFWKGEPL